MADDAYAKAFEKAFEQMEKAVDRVLRQKRFAEEANEVAKLMCEEMGLNPDEVILGDNGFSYARWETMADHATRALAGWRAVHKWVLTQAD